MASEPLVSVVVPTKDRPARLAKLLGALGRQTLDPRAFEVIVVDDASADPQTDRVLQAALEQGGLKLRFLRNEEVRGSARARNDGWRAARAPLIAFTDDDCTPTPSWLAAGLETSNCNPGAIVQGRTEPDPAEARHRSAFSRTITSTTLGPRFESCNIFYPRELLERLGGFDETFALPVTGEDTDLAWRALQTGGRAVFAPGALVLHAVHELGPWGMLAEATRWKEMARVFARHPQARAMLSRRVFWNGWHFCVIRSVVALALPSTVRRWLLMRHAVQLAERARQGGAGPWAAPLLLLYDVVEVAAVACGGLKYRTLVL